MAPGIPAPPQFAQPNMGTSFLSAGERRFKSLKLTADRISHDLIEEELQGRFSGLILSEPGHHGAGIPAPPQFA
jgi:hypothetical protein